MKSNVRLKKGLMSFAAFAKDLFSICPQIPLRLEIIRIVSRFVQLDWFLNSFGVCPAVVV